MSWFLIEEGKGATDTVGPNVLNLRHVWTGDDPAPLPDTFRLKNSVMLPHLAAIASAGAVGQVNA